MNRIENRIRIRFEFIKDAEYRIYFSHTDEELYDRIKSLIAAHKSVYTPYLGITEHIANFKFIEEVNVKQISPNNFEEIHSAISENMIKKVDFGDDGEYFSETMPMEMDTDRTVTEYSNILFERNGNTITAKLKKFWKLGNGENIVFM